MSLSSPFILRPVATTLLTIAVALAGGIAYFMLPVSPLPQVDYPTIQVSGNLPGASPETMASSVATPLERQFGRIAGVTEMTSSSSLGSTNITLQFDLSRDTDAAARDVQAAINAARGQLPANLPNNPGYRKVNPADAPILILSLTSDVYDKARMYDEASSVLQQKLAQVEGVGQVNVWGGANPAVRVDVNPTALNTLGLSMGDVRTALGNANVNRPKGSISGGGRTWSLATTDQLPDAAQYRPLVLAFRNGSALRLGDVAAVTDSVEDVRNFGVANGRPSIQLALFRQPGANIIDTVDRVVARLPQLRAGIPAGMSLAVALDRTTTIRASVRDVQRTLLLSVGLVILVVFVFLRDVRSTLIPSVVVPVSLVGTFGVMYLLGYSLDNLSLMALTIATGFVVDDAIVVVENVTRHVEAGVRPRDAALLGAGEIGFTVLSISVSLVAVFIPLFLMGGYIGRLFREFAVTLSVAIAVSMLVSLTTTPMMCALLLRPRHARQHGRLYRATDRLLDRVNDGYASSLRFMLRHSFATLVLALGTVALTVCLALVIPVGFFPQQDTGRLMGQLRADQDTSFQAMSRLVTRFNEVVMADPAVENVLASAGGGSSNSGRMFVTLKARGTDGAAAAEQVVARLRQATARIPGASLTFQSVQDIRTGGRGSAAAYQYTLQGDNFAELAAWAPKLADAMRRVPGIADVNSDQQNGGLQTSLDIDRDAAARLGITPQAIDGALYDAFGQRPVSTIYRQLNQYRVVMGVAAPFQQNPDALKNLYVPGAGGSAVPLAAFAGYRPSTSPLSINHQGQFPAITLSFNLVPGTSLSQAIDRVEQAGRDIGMPAAIQGRTAGTAKAFQDAKENMPWLIAGALVAVYIILGILYESLIHPVTILSTIPSAGVGALLALLLTGTELGVIAVIGILLLIGIVKKNAIMMIDFALDAERTHGKPPAEAIYEAAVLRFRPITMTTLAALLGGLPLALGTGVGSELRRPLGIAIVGGLIFSQMLTLYTTPVIYLYMDRLRLWTASLRRARQPGRAAALAGA